MKYGAAILGPLALILLGALLLLNNLQFGFDLAWIAYQYWPLVLIALGVSHIVKSMGCGRAPVGGMILTLIGIGFQIHALRPEFTIGTMFRTFWPIIFVVVGVSQLLKMSPLWGRRRMP